MRAMLDEELVKLIERWEESGGTATADILCEGCPQLLQPLRDAIEQLCKANQALNGIRFDGPNVDKNASPIPLRFKVNVPGYAVLGEISRGGQAIVLKAVQQSTGRT